MLCEESELPFIERSEEKREGKGVAQWKSQRTRHRSTLVDLLDLVDVRGRERRGVAHVVSPDLEVHRGRDHRRQSVRGEAPVLVVHDRP